MYVNFPLLASYNLTPEDVVVLQAISQNKIEDNSILINEICVRLYFYEEQGLVKYIKGTKKDSKFKLIRISDKGSKILDSLEIPEIEEEDLQIFEWLESIYKKEGKEIGNTKKTKLNISLFKKNSGIVRNHLAYLCKSFISDEKEIEYSQRLEYLFFKPSNVFTVRFDINSSRLYQYYLKRKEQFDAKFLTIDN